ncbi:hypothetical protein BAVI_09916 [Neobacillus vireti LMG 21834]|uniref:Uncharacterized protein n=1 Tax=Neobacillus vireti LMG 21834 TaxID=1131730 RepID=A0AB94IPZ2_9BACI|nr:hypothetical protein BAVI_09916 [Neobacillus vireti LMG 21834]KLT15662.1 hypothetical protein AA980_20645 [Neobacillus vireti]
MKTIKSFILWLLSLVAVLIFTFVISIFISFIQEKLFLPKNYLIWIFKSPVAKFVFIYDLYSMFIFFCLFNKNLSKSSISSYHKKSARHLPVFWLVPVALVFAFKNQYISF